MGLRIQNNIEAFNTHRQLTATATQASKSMEKLSSGYRINRAADDAAGLGISEKMRGQIGGLAQAQRNAQVGANEGETISMASPAFGGDATAGGLSNLTGLSATTASDVALSVGTMTIDTIDSMIENVSKQRGQYGAVQNRLEHRLSNLATY